MAVTKMKGYFEAFFEQPPPFKLSLIETVTEETVWTATIREGSAARCKPFVLLIPAQMKRKNLNVHRSQVSF